MPADVGAGAEMLAGTAQHDDPDRRIAAEAGDFRRERRQQRLVVGIAALRPVERQRRDAARVDVGEKRVGGHMNELFHLSRSGTGRGGVVRVMAVSGRHRMRQFRKARRVVELAAVAGRERERPFVVEADVVRIGIADRAVHLQGGARRRKRRA